MSVLTFGEALLRLTPPGNLPLELASGFECYVAGSELNVAAGLQALGTPARFLTALPASALGETVQREVRRLGVSGEYLAPEAQGRQGIFYLETLPPPRASRVIYDRAYSAFSRLSAADVPAGVLAGATWLHVSGITLALGQGPRAFALALMQLAHTSGVPISFDVNHRRLLLPDAAQAAAIYGPALELAAVMFVAERDLPLLGPDLSSVAPNALKVMTRGALGSVALPPQGKLLAASATPASGPGRIGRGDAFAAGFLHAYLGKQPLPTCLAWASAAAALKMSTPGDQLLCSAQEVQQLLSSATFSDEPLR